MAERLTLGRLAVWKHAVQKGTAWGRVLHVHGISEHSARHQPTFDALNSIGLEVVRFDLRGAGESGGRRQHIEHFSDYVSDTATVHNWIVQALPPLPLFLMGHSLGGAIATHFAAEYGKLLKGLVLVAPAYRLGSDISPLKVWVGKCLVKLFPTLRLYSASSDGLSRDPKVVSDYRNDPLASHFNTLGQGEAVLKAIENLPLIASKTSNPTVIFHGTSDRVIHPEGSFSILRSLGSKRKELHYLPGVFHEPHLDWESEKFFGLLTRWFLSHRG
jgi:acylglycerol lipase